MALGEFELERPAQLLGLLATMAANRITDWARHQKADRRNRHPETPLDHVLVARLDPPTADPSPSQQIVLRETLEQFRKKLTSEERIIADLRAQGVSWDAIADRLGATAEATRKRFRRAMNRAAEELGMESVDA